MADRIARRTRSGAGTIAAAALFLAGAATDAAAQKVRNTYGSPLDTIRNTHLTTTAPEAKDFVRATSPDKSKLQYTPLTGVEPDRPKPRDLKGVAALQAELESAGAKNEGRAKGLTPRKPTARAKSKPVRAEGGSPAS